MNRLEKARHVLARREVDAALDPVKSPPFEELADLAVRCGRLAGWVMLSQVCDDEIKRDSEHESLGLRVGHDLRDGERDLLPGLGDLDLRQVAVHESEHLVHRPRFPKPSHLADEALRLFVRVHAHLDLEVLYRARCSAASSAGFAGLQDFPGAAAVVAVLLLAALARSTAPEVPAKSSGLPGSRLRHVARRGGPEAPVLDRVGLAVLERDLLALLVVCDRRLVLVAVVQRRSRPTSYLEP